MIHVKRVYESPQAGDGTRFLVDKVWPRGMKKESLDLDDWLKEVAPSDSLRTWFGHDPKKWNEFRERYFVELEGKSEAVRTLLQAARGGDVTLLYSARDTEHNNAVALKQYLEQHQ